MGELFDAVAIALKAGIGFQAIFFALLAIGINLQFGYTGLLNFGQIAFAMLGGFGIAVSVTQWGLNFWVGVVIGLLAAVVLALLLGLPTLRLRADYLAIATIAAAEGLRLVFRSVSATEITGGTRGLAAFNRDFVALAPWETSKRYSILGTSWSGAELWVALVGWTIVALSCLLVWALVRSPWGRVVKSVREDEDAVRALGKNVYAIKMQALILGGVLGSLGGVLYVLPRAVQPDGMARSMTFFVWTVLLLGGAATLFGPVLGAMLFWAVFMLLRAGLREGMAGTLAPTQVENIGGLAVGVALMLLVIFRPQGILGNKKELAFDAR
jgi:neutral amino acid transport system permease protein